MTAHDRRPSRVLPRRLQEAHYRFLATSKNLSDQAGPGAILSMDTVCERIGLEDRSVCEGIVEDHIEGGYLLQDPGTNETGLFRLHRGRAFTALQNRRLRRY